MRPYSTQVYQLCLLLYCVPGLVLQLQHLSATLVFYAPPHGLAAILADMADVLGPHRQAVVARELTKLHEEFYRCAGRSARFARLQVALKQPTVP